MFSLSPNTIASMVECTLALLIMLYFLSLRGRTRDTWLMIGFMGLGMLVYLLDSLLNSSVPPVHGYFRASHAVVWATWTLYWVWCAYAYRGQSLSRESLVALLVGGILLAVIVARLVFPGFTYTISEKPDTFHAFLIAIAVLHGWAIIALLRRSQNPFRHPEQSAEPNPTILKNRRGQALRAMALLMACPFTLYLIILLFGGGPYFHHIAQSVLLLGVLIVHVSHTAEKTTFQVKLIALPLATILTLIGLLPALLYGYADDTYLVLAEAPFDLSVQQGLRVFAWLIPGSVLFTLITFGLFYRAGLLRQLGLLLDGVRRIEAGDLQTVVPVLTRDEIGSLSMNLNQMTSSLKAAQEELENRVEERTAQLQASLAQLEATQAQLVLQEKMASLGQLTAGIAHEIKNPLNFVNNFAEVNEELADELRDAYAANPDIKLADLLDVVDDLKQNAGVINQHGKRADGIVHAMMQHASGGSGQREATDVNALVSEYIDLAYHGKRAQVPDLQVEIKRDLEGEAVTVEVVPQEIGRVLLNLLGNAFDAVHENAESVDGEYAPTVTVSTRQIDGHMEIRVSDNGPGIAVENKDRIFEPFFTTKPTGTGTGLGLSLSYDIVTQGHGGTLTVKSEEGKGATFIVRLPVNHRAPDSST